MRRLFRAQRNMELKIIDDLVTLNKAVNKIANQQLADYVRSLAKE